MATNWTTKSAMAACCLFLFHSPQSALSFASQKNDIALTPKSRSESMPISSTSLAMAKEATAGMLNPIVASVKPSKTVEIFSLVKEMEAAGDTVTSLCVGEPDFLPPKAVLDATLVAVQSGDTRYTAVTGTVNLRNAIAEDLKKRKGVEYNPANEIVVGNGAKQCVYQGVLATCGEGDKVLVPAPYWPSYPEMVSLVGAEPVVIEAKAKDGYLINPEALRSTLEENPEIKLMILCNPSNPTGGVYHHEKLQAIANVFEGFP